MSIDNQDEWGDSYARPITVDGQAYYEVGMRDPDGEGYHTIRIPFEEDTDEDELESDIRKAKEHLEQEIGRMESDENWFEGFSESSDLGW